MFFSSFSIPSIGCVRVPTATPFSQRLLRAKLRQRPKETAVGKCWLRCHSVSDFSWFFNPWKMVWITVPTVTDHSPWIEKSWKNTSHICAHGRTCKLYQSWRLIKFSLFSASESVLPVSSHWGKALSENIALNICTHCELMTSFCHCELFFSMSSSQSCWGSGALTTKCCLGASSIPIPATHMLSHFIQKDLWKHTTLIVDKSHWHWQVWDGMSMKTYETHIAPLLTHCFTAPMVQWHSFWSVSNAGAAGHRAHDTTWCGVQVFDGCHVAVKYVLVAGVVYA